jgi:hypothetical protein
MEYIKLHIDCNIDNLSKENEKDAIKKNTQNVHMKMKMLEPYMSKINRILTKYVDKIITKNNDNLHYTIRDCEGLYVLYYIINNYEILQSNNANYFEINFQNGILYIPRYHKKKTENNNGISNTNNSNNLKNIKEEKKNIYNKELKRIEKIYDVFIKKYITLQIKNKHLSNELKKNNNKSSYCNIRESVSILDKKYKNEKGTIHNIKKMITKIWEELLMEKKYPKEYIKSIIGKCDIDSKFIIIIINSLFNKYIDMIKYNIKILNAEGEYTEKDIDEYLYNLPSDEFVLDNDDSIIMMNNDIIIKIMCYCNKTKEIKEMKKIKLFITKSNKLDIIFTD